jgi:putative FmdB family regulatory protein
MPIYEYRCTACGDEVEVMQKMSDRPLRKCRKCAGKLEKLFSRTSFQLKGGGWYAQGYGGSDGSKSGSKTDAKSDAKSTGKKADGDSSSGKKDKKETKSAGASC